MNADRGEPADGNPRAFVTATGFVFQIAGLVLAFGGCCIWSLSGLLQREASRPIDVVLDYARVDARSQAIAMVGIAVTFIGGLGLLATGIGLQAEKPRSGRQAMYIAAVVGVGWWSSAIAYLAVGAALWKIAVAVVMALVTTVLFLLAGNSARILRLHPPPADLEIVTDEFLEQLSRHRKRH